MPSWMQEKQAVAGDIHLEICPDFNVVTCTAGYPKTLLGQGYTKKQADNLYKQLLLKCDRVIDSYNKAFKRCKRFRP